MQSRGVRRPSVCLSVRPSVPSLQLGTGKTAAVRSAGWWLVGWLVSRVCRASVCPRAAEGRQARVCARVRRAQHGCRA